MDANDISKLVELADTLVYEKTGQHLEAVEKDILRQTLKGKKLSAIQFASYENSYLQRFIAPKLWNRLSVVAGEKVRKKTVLEVLQRLQSQRSASSCTAASHSQLSANAQAELNGHAAFNGSVSCPELRNGRTTSEESDSVALHEPTSSLAEMRCINPHCPNRQNSNQLREPSQADHTESKTFEDRSPDSTTEEFNSSSQSSQPDNPDETKNSTYGFPSYMNFMKPGVPLLLSLVILSFLFALSWLANWYGVTNHQAGQLPLAQFGYSWALKLNPWSAAAHYNQGATYEDQYNYELARAEYQLAIEGGLVEAYNNQARLYILQGNYDAAVSLLRIGLGLAKNDRVRADMYKNRGWARLHQGRYAEAKLDLTEAIKLKSDSPSGDSFASLAPAYCLLAQVLEREGDKKGALVQWENCLGFAYQPNTPEEDKWIHLARQRLDAE